MDAGQEADIRSILCDWPLCMDPGREAEIQSSLVLNGKINGSLSIDHGKGRNPAQFVSELHYKLIVVYWHWPGTKIRSKLCLSYTTKGSPCMGANQGPKSGPICV